MPVFLDTCSTAGQTARHDKASLKFQNASEKYLNIGLINNMPDAALRATERQFLSLLESASEGMQVRFSLYTLPGVPRSDEARLHLSGRYASTEALLEQQLDGLIVTGRGPIAANLKDEPYWPSFTQTLEWARKNTHSTVWSCLAAHAATLHMSDIGRVRRGEKQFGILACERTSEHLLTVDAPSRFQLPHSRWNGVEEDKLEGCGYNVLTRTAEGEVDTFVKQEDSLFVFFQGHPEYDSDTLLREYRRDIGLFLSGETRNYPAMPRNYFDAETTELLHSLSQDAALCPDERQVADLFTALDACRVENTWQSTACSLYKNWLRYLCIGQKKPFPTDDREQEHPRAITGSRLSSSMSWPAANKKEKVVNAL